MANNYYFLVAGLPDIILDNTKKAVSFSDFLNDLVEQVTFNDAELLKLLRLPFDNKNLITVIEKQQREFDPRGTFTIDELEQEIKLPDVVPIYMRNFIEHHKEGKMPYPELSAEDQLNWLFFEEMTTHSNEFIREWFSFDLDMRNVLAGINCRRLSTDSNQTNEMDTSFLSLSKTVICRNDVSELILKSNAPDFSLSNRLPWIEKLIAMDQGNLIEFEKNIDTLRWNTLNELTMFTYFQIETILAFCIKLGIVVGEVDF